MDELELVSARFKQTFEKVTDYGPSVSEGSWHGPTLLESLETVDHAQAIARPIGWRHTIWEIVNHCSYWMNAVTIALQSNEIASISGTEDWPSTGETATEWAQDLEKLLEDHKELARAIETLEESNLEERIRSKFGARYFEFTYRKMLHGISDHNTYHAGQISLLSQA
jgi:uncharacterized damage-inducible protein DinB